MDEADVVCRRAITLREAGEAEREVTIRIGTPQQNPDGPDWVCPFDFVDASGVPLALPATDGTFASEHQSRGADGFQAMTLAMQGARYVLGRVDAEVRVFGTVDRTAMIDRNIFGYSQTMTRHLERVVDAELERINALLADPATRRSTREEFDLSARHDEDFLRAQDE